MGENINKAAYWDAIYREEVTPGWDLAAPAPSLLHALKAARLKPGREAAPGCGFGHDARLLAEHGFKVDAFDISPRALAGARKRHRGVKNLMFH